MPVGVLKMFWGLVFTLECESGDRDEEDDKVFKSIYQSETLL